jgi:putative transposase
MSIIHQAYKFALDPTPTQARACNSHVGASRYVYNYLLGCMKATNDLRKAEISSGVAKSALTPYFPTSHYALRKIWNTKKDLVAPWWRENSKEAYSDGTKRLSLGVSNHIDSLTGKVNRSDFLNIISAANMRVFGSPQVTSG